MPPVELLASGVGLTSSSNSHTTNNPIANTNASTTTSNHRGQSHQDKLQRHHPNHPNATSSNSNNGVHANGISNDPRLWARVSWMPHASLSQTSHVAISIRAALAKIDSESSSSSSSISSYGNRISSTIGENKNNTNDSDSCCWQVHVAVRGLAGLELVPVGSTTRSAPLTPLFAEDNNSNIGNNRARCRYPSVTEATHVCRWDNSSSSNNNNSNININSNSNSNSNTNNNLIQIPLRWRDLPRDAYLEFTVTTGSRPPLSSTTSSGKSTTTSYSGGGGSGTRTELYKRTTLSLFDDYGKLRSGLNKIPLHHCKPHQRGRATRHDNPGLVYSTQQQQQQQQQPPFSSSSSWQRDDDDPVWKASKILEQLDRFEDQHNSSSSNSTTANVSTNTTSHVQKRGGAGNSREVSPNPLRGNNSNSNSNSNSHTHKHKHRHNFGDIPSVSWLDRMARDYCEQTMQEGKDRSKHLVVWPPSSSSHEQHIQEQEEPPPAYLVVEIPSFDVPVVHEETFYPTPQQGPSGSVTPLDIAMHQQHHKRQQQQQQQTSSSIEPPPFQSLSAVPFLDYENENDSPIDDKYRTLAHDLLRGLVDPALKPDRTQRDKLAAIIASPSHHPTREEKDLLWRFRFSLVDNRKALTKFLLAVDWTVETEVVQAAELLEQWRKRSPIEVTDALKLLGKQVAYQTNLVRAYAIDTLAKAPDEELNLYLLQLVQALKFENSLQQQQQQEDVNDNNNNNNNNNNTADATKSTTSSSPIKKKKSSLATFLIARSSKNVFLANYLYWYLKVELLDPAHGARYREIFDELELTLARTPYPQSRMTMTHYRQGSGHPPQRSASTSTRTSAGAGSSSTASSFHHQHSSSSLLAGQTSAAASSLVNKLGESVSKLGDKLLGERIDTDSSSGQKKGGPAKTKTNANANHHHHRSVWDVLTDQDKFISGVMDVQMSYLSKARQPAKEAHLRSVLEKEGYYPKPVRLNFPMPCAPEIMVNGVFPEKAKVFKSAVYPALIEFNVYCVVDKSTFIGIGGSSSGVAAGGKHQRVGARASVPTSPASSNDDDDNSIVAIPPQLKSYRVLMKTGDDLRQDQLVMMMIKLMDRLLKRASLDLCITPYSIIATSPSSGMIEFVEQSVPLSAILANHNNSILQFFRSVAPQKGTKYGVRPDVVSSYVRSVAGGCVLTYLMGVGDRHLDNLMITNTGRFFHIDFGFLFGRDPKPLPPAFRLTREMVEGMGGSESAEYRQFCSLACQAFNALRKSAGLVLNLLHLMSDAGIEDLSNNPSADADGVIAKVEERFRLDLTDEQAERFFLTLINDSLSALAPRLMDVFHSIAVARR